MGNIGDTVSEILSKFARLLGIKPSGERRTELMEQKLAAAKANNVDQLEDLKDKVRQFEVQALHKKKEYEAARGDIKRVVGGEIERLFRELDRLHGLEIVIAGNIERISVAQAKIQEYQAAQAKGLEEDGLDDIALELQDAFEGLKVADRASRDLEHVKYQAPEVSPVNAENRMAEVAGELETAAGLSAETRERLKQLEPGDV